MGKAKKIIFSVLFVCFTFLLVGTLNAKADTTTLVSAVDGASIRLAVEGEVDQGLRFYATLDDSVLNADHGFYVIYGNATVTQLEEAINVATDGEVVLNSKKVYKVAVNGADSNKQYSVVLIGIPEVGYADKITVVPYVVDGGVEKLSTTTTTRSVADVALKMAYAGEGNSVSSAILSYINSNYKAVYKDITNTYVVASAIYDTKREEIAKQFLADWNKKFSTSFTGFDEVNGINGAFWQNARSNSTTVYDTSNLYKFFQDTEMRAKWEWTLDFTKTVGNMTNSYAVAQYNLLKSGTVPTGDNWYYGAHFISHYVSFFTATNYSTGYQTGSFGSDLNRYDQIPSYNTTVYRSEATLVKVGSTINLPVLTPADGYEWNGYYLSDTKYTTYTVSSGNAYFKAKFDINTYNITYWDVELNQAITGLTPVTYNVNDAITLAATYEKSGYVFAGWYELEDCSGTPVTGWVAGEIGAKKYYAKMVASSAVEVEVSYNLNEGSWTADFAKTFNTGSTSIVATKFRSGSDGLAILIGTKANAIAGGYWYRVFLKYDSALGAYKIVAINTGTSATTAAATTEDWDYVLAGHDSCTTTASKTAIKALAAAGNVGKYMFIDTDLSQYTAATTGLNINCQLYEAAAFKNVSKAFTFRLPNVALPTPVKDGYTFVGWCAESDLSDTPFTVYPGYVAADGVTSITYYAKWIDKN